ncbi:MAG: hypothetical protein HQ509_04910 [Candidatus Marinimicrobia bacterium]|nr:hypothetical protein [Candidatus Neomarinimicrobiota bacterium]
MKKSLRMKVGYRLRSLRKPIFHNEPVRFSADGNGVNSMLVILPDLVEEYRVARHYFKSVQDLHPEIHFTFLIPTSHIVDSVESSSNGIIIITENDLDRWHLPEKSFITKVFSRPYDAAINLSSRSNLIADWIMRFAQCPLRIGYHSQKESHNYNLLIERKGRVSLEKTYVQIQRLLGL